MGDYLSQITMLKRADGTTMGVMRVECKGAVAQLDVEVEEGDEVILLGPTASALPVGNLVGKRLHATFPRKDVTERAWVAVTDGKRVLACGGKGASISIFRKLLGQQVDKPTVVEVVKPLTEPKPIIPMVKRQGFQGHYDIEPPPGLPGYTWREGMWSMQE